MEKAKDDFQRIYYCGQFLIIEIKLCTQYINFSGQNKTILKNAMESMEDWRKNPEIENSKKMTKALAALFINFRELVNANLDVRYHWNLFCSLSKRNSI